jgi:hypothetical protein
MVFYRVKRGGFLVHQMLSGDKELVEPSESERGDPGTPDRDTLIFGIGVGGFAALIRLAK